MRRFGRCVPAALLLPLLFLGAAACGGDDAGGSAAPEPWVDRPVAEWPDFALTNDIVYTDTIYAGVANAFLVDTGTDTVAVTVKHMFLALDMWRDDVTGIDPGAGFVAWRFRSSRDPSLVVEGHLLNGDPHEPIGDFGSLKDRDWLVFAIDSVPTGVYPLKIRWTPLEPGEVVRAVGRSLAQRDDRDPVPRPLVVYQAAGTYYYVQPRSPGGDAVQTSGSPVIDAGGYLVGIVSGAVGRLGVIGGVAYLRRVLDARGVPVSPLAGSRRHRTFGSSPVDAKPDAEERSH